jgi:hypothetical protein
VKCLCLAPGMPRCPVHEIDPSARPMPQPGCETTADRKRAVYWQRRESGLCVFGKCPESAVPGKAKCERHQKEARAVLRRYDKRPCHFHRSASRWAEMPLEWAPVKGCPNCELDYVKRNGSSCRS